MFGRRKHTDRRIRELEWKRDLAIQCGLWTIAIRYEQDLLQAQRPGESTIEQAVRNLEVPT